MNGLAVNPLTGCIYPTDHAELCAPYWVPLGSWLVLCHAEWCLTNRLSRKPWIRQVRHCFLCYHGAEQTWRRRDRLPS